MEAGGEEDIVATAERFNGVFLGWNLGGVPPSVHDCILKVLQAMIPEANVFSETDGVSARLFLVFALCQDITSIFSTLGWSNSNQPAFEGSLSSPHLDTKQITVEGAAIYISRICMNREDTSKDEFELAFMPRTSGPSICTYTFRSEPASNDHSADNTGKGIFLAPDNVPGTSLPASFENCVSLTNLLRLLADALEKNMTCQPEANTHVSALRAAIAELEDDDEDLWPNDWVERFRRFIVSIIG